VSARILDGAAVAAQLHAEVAERTHAHIERGGWQPRLAVVLASDDPADRVYAEHKERACAEVGMTSKVIALPATSTERELIEAIDRLNADPAVSGVLVQLPLPAHMDTLAALAAVAPGKDVDGLTPENLGLLLQSRPRFVPATASGVVELLRRERIATHGARVVIVGRSVAVARPLAMLLGARGDGANATVTLTDLHAPRLSEIARRADILVAACEQPRAIGAELVRPGATVIDTGLHWIEDGASARGRRLVGDVDTEAVREVAGAIAPAPGGLGPITIAMLLANTLRAAGG
jgi:methylenetetrahydrofolate dehydrogenase (NADP+) / methenyltetrahydrofolate cyclohydrolase